MTDETRSWLKALWEALWVEKRGVRDVGMQRESYTYHAEVRRLTVEEWARLETILRDEHPIVELVTTGFGFGCGMTIYDDPVDPVYPGVPQEIPDVLLVVDKNHLPLEGRVQQIGKKSRLADRTYFDDGWAAFSPFTHDTANAERLVAVGLPAPKSKEYYEY